MSVAHGYKYLSDGERKVDYVLLHTEDDLDGTNGTLDDENVVDPGSSRELFESDDERKSREYRDRFLDSITSNGDLEIEQIRLENTNYICTLCHLPPQTAFKMAEMTKLLLPLDVDHSTHAGFGNQAKLKDYYDVTGRIADWCDSKVREELPFEVEQTFQAPFDMRDKDKFMDHDDPNKFLTPADRSYLVYKVMEAAAYGDRHRGKVGIKRMVNDGHFTGAFALHSGPLEPMGSDNLRSVLRNYWANAKKFWRAQPLDHIKLYFGSSVAFYFLWLGYYTRMLVWIAMFGLIIFFYSIFSLPGDQVEFVCNSNLTMCPICDNCDTYPLQDNCAYAYISHIADNNSIVLFAFAVSIWALFFAKLWKRTQAEYAFRWNVYELDEEYGNIRPQYAALSKETWINPITGETEPHFPRWMKTLRTLSAFSILMMMVLVVITFIIMCIFYRVFISSLFSSLNVYQPSIVASTTAAVINLAFITLCNFVYGKLSVRLTDWEMHRTEEEYDDSLTLKSYVFQFVNYYSSIVYIAFFKGKFAGNPGDHKEVLGARPEQCTGSCMVELSIQLAIIMIGNQLLNNCMEIFTPMLMTLWSRVSSGYKDKEDQQGSRRSSQYRAEEDGQFVESEFNLLEEGVFMPDFSGLFSEYLEMVIQFGFCTIFVVALPIAPLFALLNNIAEIRIDANKLLAQVRRPVTKVVKDIGAWEYIIDMVSVLAVVANGCLIAFTSDFIPRLIYYYTIGDHSFDGFYQSNLRSYNMTQEYMADPVGNAKYENVTECWYKHDVYSDKVTGEMTKGDWEILFGQMAFLVVFEHILLIVAFLIEVGIDNRPENLEIRMKRRKHMQTKHLKKH